MSDPASKRSLPSRMGSSKDGEDESGKKKHAGTSRNAQKEPGFSKLLDRVVFVLSGFVNPERSTLRSQALDMGAEYRPDWTSDCTLLVCAFANTPKFRQVQSDNGTIISKTQQIRRRCEMAGVVATLVRAEHSAVRERGTTPETKDKREETGDDRVVDGTKTGN